MDVLSSQTNFRTLSVKDLLEAREQYHLHLLNKKNVVGTAIGLYLIRNSDPMPETPKADRPKKTPKGERTFANSSVRRYSWPCVLVLVDKWMDEKQLAATNPTDTIPKTLFMPDGRMIPVCVVKVSPIESVTTVPEDLGIWPESRLGGGFPIYSKVQGRKSLASVGCLVTDGHMAYALTSRHAVGKKGDAVYSDLKGDEIQVGSASNLALTRLPFNEVYPTLPKCRGYSTLDVGLIEVNDVGDWTSQVYGIPKTLEVADLNEMNIGTQLIDCKVRAFGAVSGLVEGTIKGLFYKYKSVSGYDYIADLLIAPKDDKFTHPGDSGTVWHLVLTDPDNKNEELVYPLATQWGGQGFDVAERRQNFALSTLLCNVLHHLDVELVKEHNTRARPYWGATGHYSIARYAINYISNKRLRDFFTANADRISFDTPDILNGEFENYLDPGGFVALADVPDIVWKKVPSKVDGGRDRGSQKPEHPVHYADIDEKAATGNKTLMAMCLANKSNVSVEVWRKFYTDLGHTSQASRGLLPFRVWQFYDEMVAYVSKKDYAGFLCAAGILSHYVGDACQPLHGSIYANGYKDEAVDSLTSGGKPKKDWPAKGIHGAYETKMIDDYAEPLFAKIDALGKHASFTIGQLNNGHDCAAAIVAVMAEAQKLISPKRLCNRYITLGEGQSKPVIKGLWDSYGVKTAQTMCNGSVLLAAIWDAAWAAGGGPTAPVAKLKPIDKDKLDALYRDEEFVKSLDLDHIGEVLK